MKIEKLSIQEEEVMRCVWQLGRCNIKAIVELLPSPTPPYTTVASVVGNLKRKGYVIAQRKGNGFEYMPAVKEKDYKRHFVSGFVRDYFKNSFREMVSFFAQEEKISPDELKGIIDEIEKGNS
ncbi:BlaI/MecI/CopY family transcriptional regulator [Hoylesella loescheii]|uniref:BlaI/MecI/CopY family transcriptional regulator n=1 Tax=Hoylesella loescheii TaxID=840 RepID=UPI0026F1AFF9|nr:BlaI/MecI/CopY family transcriptional regulator [Hoylesella loescheii]